MRNVAQVGCVAQRRGPAIEHTNEPSTGAIKGAIAQIERVAELQDPVVGAVHAYAHTVVMATQLKLTRGVLSNAASSPLMTPRFTMLPIGSPMVSISPLPRTV